MSRGYSYRRPFGIPAKFVPGSGYIAKSYSPGGTPDPTDVVVCPDCGGRGVTGEPTNSSVCETCFMNGVIRQQTTDPKEETA